MQKAFCWSNETNYLNDEITLTWKLDQIRDGNGGVKLFFKTKKKNPQDRLLTDM